MSVARAQREISQREFLEWQMVEQIEPFGERRADLRSAMVACVMANAWRGKNAKAFEMEDFMLTFEDKPRHRASTAEVKAKLLQYVACCNR